MQVLMLAQWEVFPDESSFQPTILNIFQEMVFKYNSLLLRDILTAKGGGHFKIKEFSFKLISYQKILLRACLYFYNFAQAGTSEAVCYRRVDGERRLIYQLRDERFPQQAS